MHTTSDSTSSHNIPVPLHFVLYEYLRGFNTFHTRALICKVKQTNESTLVKCVLLNVDNHQLIKLRRMRWAGHVACIGERFIDGYGGET